MYNNYLAMQAPPPFLYMRRCLYALKVQAHWYRAGRLLAALLFLLSGFTAATQAQAQTVEFTSASYTVEEGGELVVMVKLTGKITQAFNAQVSFSFDDDASAGDFEDGQAGNRQVNFSSLSFVCGNGCTRTVVFKTKDDNLFEGDESGTIKFSSPFGSGSATFTITDNDAAAPPPNVAPTANAGPDQPAVPSGSQVTLDGSGSTDDDGTIPADGYAWTRAGGSGTSPVTLTSSMSSMPTFTADTLAPGDSPVTHEFSLMVTDDDGAPSTNQSTVTITVIEPAVGPPKLTLTVEDNTVTEGETLTLTARLDRPPTEDVEVGMIAVESFPAVGSDDFADGNPFQKTLVTFTPAECPNIEGTNDCEKTIELETLDDNRVEGNEPVSILLYTGPFFVDDVTNITSNTATLVIADNERLHLSKTSYSVEEGAALTVTAQLFIKKGLAEKEDDIFLARDIGVGLRLHGQSAGATDFKANQFDRILETIVLEDCQGSNIKVCNKEIVIETLNNDVVGEDKHAVIELYSNPPGLVVNAASFVITDDDTVPADAPPVAHAGFNRVVDLGATVTLDGSRSSDPHQLREGIGLEYEWTPPTGVTLNSNTVARPTFVATNDLAGQTLTFSLEVEATTMTLANGDKRKSAEASTVEIAVRTRASYYENFETDEDGMHLFIDERPLVINVSADLDFPLADDPDRSDDDAEDFYKYRLAPDPELPAGLSFDGAARKLTGTPTEVSPRQTYTYQARTTISVRCRPGRRTPGCDPDDPTQTTATSTIVAHSVEFDIEVVDPPPTVDAGTGPAQPALPLTTVSLSGTATNPGQEDDTLTILWTAADVQLTGADTLTPSFVAPLQDVPNKVLTLTLTATDGDGVSAMDTVLVTVAANSPPTVSAAVDAGTVMPITVGQTVTLAGTATDTENEFISLPLGISWTAPSAVSLDSTVTLAPTFVAPALLAPDTPRTLAFALIATDNRGAVGSDSVEITVYPPGYQPPPPPDNVPPVVNAGDNDVVAGGQTVALAGTATDTDGDDAMLAYAWTTTSSDVTLSADDVPAPTFDAPVVASDTEITLTLTVTDEDGGSASDTVVISVVAMPTIESRTTGRIEEGEDATFALRVPGLLYPPDTPAELRTFTLEIMDESGVSNAAAEDLAPAADLTVVFPVGQQVTNFDVPTLDDSTAEPLETLALGLGTSTATVQIADNEPYSVTFSPDPVQIIEGGQQVVDIMLDRPFHGRIEGSSLAATAGFDASAGTATVDDPATRDIAFSTGDASVPITFQEGTASDQVVQVTLVAVDDGQDEANETARLVLGGSTLLSDNELQITIYASGLPVANAGTDQEVLPGTPVTLDGRGSTNNDGTSPVDGYSWTRTGGTGSSSVVLSSSTAAMPTFTADDLAAEDAPVTHVFSLVVTEGTSASPPDTVTITVTSDPNPDLTVPITEEGQIIAARTDTLKRGVGMLGSEIGSSLARAVSGRGGQALPQNRLSLGAAAGSEASGLQPGVSAGTDFDPTGEYGSVKDAVHGLQASQLLGSSEDGARFAGVWLQGDVNRFKDRSGEGERDGDITSLHWGLDVRLTPQLLVGLGGSWHDGDFDYTGQGGIAGKAGFEIASLYPYVNWDRDGMSAWAAVGLGSGELKVTEDDADRTSDLDHKLAALGVAQHFAQSERIDTVLRLEAFYSNLEVEGTQAGQQALDYDGFDTEVWQLRGQGEVGWTLVEREGLHLRPYAALGLLLEDGGERGIEQEVGVDLDTDDLHLRAEGRYHVLDQGSRVYGYSLSADYDSGGDSRGLLFALRSQQGRQRGFEDFDTNSSLRESQDANGRQTEAELGYGFWLGRGGLLKPYLVRRFASERDSSELGLDYRLRALQMRLGFEQSRSDTDQSEDDRFSIKAKLEF